MVMIVSQQLYKEQHKRQVVIYEVSVRTYIMYIKHLHILHENNAIYNATFKFYS